MVQQVEEKRAPRIWRGGDVTSKAYVRWTFSLREDLARRLTQAVLARGGKTSRTDIVEEALEAHLPAVTDG